MAAEQPVDAKPARLDQFVLAQTSGGSNQPLRTSPGAPRAGHRLQPSSNAAYLLPAGERLGHQEIAEWLDRISTLNPERRARVLSESFNGARTGRETSRNFARLVTVGLGIHRAASGALGEPRVVHSRPEHREWVHDWLTNLDPEVAQHHMSREGALIRRFATHGMREPNRDLNAVLGLSELPPSLIDMHVGRSLPGPERWYDYSTSLADDAFEKARVVQGAIELANHDPDELVDLLLDLGGLSLQNRRERAVELVHMLAMESGAAPAPRAEGTNYVPSKRLSQAQFDYVLSELHRRAPREVGGGGSTRRMASAALFEHLRDELGASVIDASLGRR